MSRENQGLQFKITTHEGQIDMKLTEAQGRLDFDQRQIQSYSTWRIFKKQSLVEVLHDHLSLDNGHKK